VNSPHLYSHIDAVADRATQQIAFRRRRRIARSQFASALWVLIAAPLIALFIQLARWAGGYPAGIGFSWTALTAATIAAPILWIAFRTLSRRVAVHRRQALRAMDESLGSCERVVTADQFLEVRNRTGFMQAAVEDAESWVESARTASLLSGEREPAPIRWAWAAVPLGCLVILAAGWLAQQTLPPRAALAGDPINTNSQTPVDIVTPNEERVNPEVNERQDADPADERRADKKERNKTRQAPPANATPEGAEESQGQLADGETSEAQQSSNPSSAKGEPSTQGQPAKSDVRTPKKPAKKRAAENRKQKEQPEDQPMDPSGVTAGQGSSKGSNNTAAASDWSSRSQQATPDDEETEDEEDVEDEDEEQESRGGVQPNLRDRRPPVNRDLQIGFGNRSDPDANGRGGPGAQKKSRGVASLVLGVPIPDRVTGQPNKGRIRITQQRIVPEAEESDPVAAEDRGVRDGAVGPLPHPEMSPWLQQLVKRYFLQRRQSAKPTVPAIIQDET
jgi:hypothetical protein